MTVSYDNEIKAVMKDLSVKRAMLIPDIEETRCSYCNSKTKNSDTRCPYCGGKL